MNRASFWFFVLSVGIVLAVLGRGFGLFAPSGEEVAVSVPASPPPSVRRTSAAPATLDSGPRTLEGLWRNEDRDSGSITRVEIRAGGAGLEVKAWGRCQPSDCDWGAPQSYDREAVESGVLVLVWNHGFAVRDQDLKLLADGRLEVVTQTRFTDRSGRPDYERRDVFYRTAPP